MIEESEVEVQVLHGEQGRRTGDEQGQAQLVRVSEQVQELLTDW